MIESLVVVLREGIEAALVVGIILAYLRKVERLSLARSVYLGVALAAAASVVAAVMFSLLNFDPENEYLEGAMFGLAGVLVASMVIWMWRTARSIKVEMESKLAGIVGPTSTSASAFGLGLFTFVMVFREGVETVLFLFAATLGEFDLLSLTGALIGLALAVLFAVLLIKGSVRINLARFFSVTSFILLLLALRLLAGSVHEFAEVGALPMKKEIMAYLGFFVRDSSSMLIMIALLAAPVLMILWDGLGSLGTQSANLGALAGPERRKRLAGMRRERMWRTGLLVGALAIIFLMASTAFASGKAVDPEPIPVSAAADGTVHIPMSSLPEGQLQKFAFNADGIHVRFLAMRHADGSVHAGFDACQICGSVGYMQEGEHAICKNCNAPIMATTIGEGGGCNPLPLQATWRGSVEEGELVVPASALAEAGPRFAR